MDQPISRPSPAKPSWSNQVSALTLKTFRVLLHKPVLLFACIVLPFLAALSIGAIEKSINDKTTGAPARARANLWTKKHDVKLPKNSLIFFGPTNDITNEIMQRMAAMNGLTYNTDVVPFTSLEQAGPVIASKGGRRLITADWWTLIFFNATTPSGIATSNDTFTYFFMDEDQLFPRYTYDSAFIDGRDTSEPKLNTYGIATQIAVDAAILSYVRDPTPGAAPNDRVAMSLDFFQGADTGTGRPEDSLAKAYYSSYYSSSSSSSTLGATSASTSTVSSISKSLGFGVGMLLLKPILAVSFVPIMVLVLDIMSKEKQRKLIGPLRRMGLMDSALWISIALPIIPVCILASIAGAAGVKTAAANATIFQQVSFFVVVFMNFCYSVSLVGFGCVVAAIVSRPMLVNVFVGLTSATAIILNFVAFAPNPEAIFGGIWFDSFRAAYARALCYIFAPFYHYGKAWNDISLVTLPSIINNNTVNPFTFNEFLNTPRAPNFPIPLNSLPRRQLQLLQDYRNNVETTFFTVIYLLVAMLPFIALACYLEQVVPSLEGFSRPLHFPFTASYWTGKVRRKAAIVAGDTLALEKERSARTGSVRIVKLSKQYKGNTAVKEFSSVFENGKVYAILGHNGAGKTSLINMLSMVTSPSFGDCFMFGLDIREDTAQLQALQSLCPQFDTLYPSLTGLQHVMFYMKFRGEQRGISKAEMRQRALELLDRVGLQEAAGVRAGKYSGGMKRRLSLALACVSSTSRIVFLDEPTTGLDPLSRRKVWKVIQDLKQNRVVVLTTHSMEEADELGDHVCIMHQGRLRASGSSLFLKNRFGKGYQLTVVGRKRDEASAANQAHTGAFGRIFAAGHAGPAASSTGLNGSSNPTIELLPSSAEGAAATRVSTIRQAMEQYVKYALPGSEVVSSAAGAITIAVSRQTSRRMAAFLKLLRDDASVDWSISNSTLEEVFLKLCTDNKAVVAETEDDAAHEHQQGKLCVLCATRPADVVTLYTRAGIKVTIPYFVCAPCANGEAPPPDQGGDGYAGEWDYDDYEAQDDRAALLAGDLTHANPQQKRRGGAKTGAKAGGRAAVEGIVPFEDFVRGLPEQFQAAIRSAAQAEDGRRLISREDGVDQQVANAAGAALLGRQVTAVMLKNLKLHSKERRVNWCFVIAVIILIAVSGLTGKFIPADIDGAPTQCNEWFFKNSDSGSCDPNVISNELVRIFRFPPTNAPTQFAESGIDFVGCENTRSNSNDAYCSERTVGGSILALRLGLYGTSRKQVWYSQAKGETRIEDVLPADYFNASIPEIERLSAFNMSSAEWNTKPLPPQAIKVDAVGSAAFKDVYLSAQRVLEGKKGRLPDNCTALASSQRGLFASTRDDYKNIFAKSYPDVGLAFNEVTVKREALTFDYTLLTYPDSGESDYPNIAMYTDDKDLTMSGSKRCVSLTAGNLYRGYFGTRGKGRIYSAATAMSQAMLSSLPKPDAPIKFSKVAATKMSRPRAYDPAEEDFLVAILARSSIFIFVLLATGIMYPRVVMLLVQEKRENLVEMMRTQGLGLWQYWIGNYLYGFLSVFALNAIFFVVSVAIGNTLFTKIGIPIVFGLLVLWTHGQVCLAILLGALITKPMSAGMVSYIIHVVSAVVAPFLMFVANKDGSLSLFYLFFPPTGITDLFNILAVGRPGNPIILHVIIYFVSSILIALVGCYIHAIRPSPVGIPVHPLLGLEKYLFKKKGASFDNERDPEISKPVDDDVVAEKRNVLSLRSKVDPGEAIRVACLRKRFNTGKLAVDDISLSIRFGETFGLLGPNGAGKTTTLSMITGLLERTSGEILVDGRDIDVARSNRGGPDSLWRLIGVTPQFDTVWNELTVEEHLAFYCRLRGVPKKYLTAMVRRIAEDVELDGDAFKTKAGGLSGGMKRRLSIGIALTANPKILVLDEPTTGLDPETRRQIWKIIDGIRRSSGDRCVVITTHSMEEADALCSRIGIVCDGNLRVLGSQIHLKKKFGNGLKLTMRFAIHASYMPSGAGDSTIPLAFLQQTQHRRVSQVANVILNTLQAASAYQYRSRASPDVNITATDIAIAHANANFAAAPAAGMPRDVSWMVTLTTVLPRDAVDVASVFLALEEACRREGVEDWALTETTLEDVFVKVVGE
ncbi:hypothetical protein HDU96_004162 [Phlyctochytrium bullatum]|nr:hypothetical protein HDU96_004162 [Phlyctochytrium bullatum]